MGRQKRFMIVCHDSNLGIGVNNTLPWNIPEDMAWFKQITTDHTGVWPNIVIMGRNTWESIPNRYRPLKGRINVVISSKMEPTGPSINTNHVTTTNVFPTLESAYEAIAKGGVTTANERIPFGRAFVIGGSQLYNKAMELGDINILATELEGKYDCDAFFPEYRDKFRYVTMMDGGTSKSGEKYRMNLWESKS